MMPKAIRMFFVALFALYFSSACSHQSSISQSEDAVELSIRPREMQLKGFTQASSRRFRFLFLGFGEKNSFLKNEQKALEAVQAEVLVGRLRLKSYEGILIPSLWLQALGFDEAADFPILGWEIYTVTGTGMSRLPE